VPDVPDVPDPPVTVVVVPLSVLPLEEPSVTVVVVLPVPAPEPEPFLYDLPGTAPINDTVTDSESTRINTFFMIHLP